MKYLINILLILLSTQSFAEEKDKNWVFDRANFYIENDVYFNTDNEYSTGEMFTFLYFIPDVNYPLYNALGYKAKETYSYITFSLANQIYTPRNTYTTDFIPDDRPYAGWTYIDTTIHKTTKTQLRSLSLKVGMVGPASISEQIQNHFHDFIDSPQVNGWEHQLDNELGINLKYTQKWRYSTKGDNNFETSFIPFVAAEFGNIAINASTGFTTRIGWNIPKDYGLSSINIGNDPGIPVYGEYKNMKIYPWSFSVNFTAAGSAVMRDIFLDGNTFSESHSVEKESFVGYYGAGFTLRYENLVFDLMQIENTKQYKKQVNSHRVLSAIVSWLF